MRLRDTDGKRGIEVGIIGREGMTGLSVIFARDRARHETFMLAAVLAKLKWTAGPKACRPN
jgi:uncharacterized membrane-anchored protein